jgi:hypothetical protein
MEQLKSLEDLIEPDARNFYFYIEDGLGKAKKLTLQGLHKQVSAIKLYETVPEDVRSHFSQAQNLAVYSWFNYQFNVTCQLMGFVTVEYALKRKAGDKKGGLKNLIEKAIKYNWITDDKFEITKIREDKETPYVEVLAALMPKLRNDLAHGSEMLHNNALGSLRICADFINQIYGAEST